MFFDSVKKALLNDNPFEKTKQVESIYQDVITDDIHLLQHDSIDCIEIPGRPVAPELVQPSKVARRKLNSLQGRIALIHAICHIEFNAINLALDACYRFQSMPQQYYVDWMRVAFEESKHFLLYSGV